MIETNTMVGTGMKVDVSARRARAEARRRRASGLDAGERADPLGRLVARRGRPAAPRRDRHGAVAALVFRRAGRRRRSRSSSRVGFSSTSCGCFRTSEVTIEHRAEESVVRITCGPSTSTLHTYAAEDFPRLPDLDTVGTFTVDRESLLDTVSRVARSASRDESRPVLTGILVRFEAGKLVMAATDSYRLSVKETDARRAKCRSSRRSSRRAHWLSSRASRSRRRRSSSASTRTRSSSPRTTSWLTTRRIDGQFPNYKQLLPETFEHELTLPRERAAGRRSPRRRDGAAHLADPAALRGGRAHACSAQTQDVGEAKESLPVAFAGEPLEIGFNAEFLREGIESIHADEHPAEADLSAAPGRDRRRRGRPRRT